MPAGSARRLVALSLPPGDGFIDAAERVWAGGGAILPLDPSAPVDVVRRLLTAMRPHAVVDDEGERELPDGVGVDEGIALVVATSGSTGVPKGAELSWAALGASANATRQRLGSDPADAWLSCLPWQHIGGLQVWLRARSASQRLEIHPRFDVSAVAATSATLVSLVPTQLSRLLDAEVDLRRFRVVLLGGAPAPSVLLDRAREAGANVVTTYGMSETCGGCVYDGTPLSGVEVVTRADGRIRIRGPVLMAGYRLRADLTSAVLEDGWLLTEDLGSLEAGRLVVVGRADDVVVTGGENVATAAVEEAMSSHPAVGEVAVTGVPDAEWGERLVAVVVATGDEAPTLEALRRWVAERAGSSAAPRGLVVVQRIPRLPSGKPDRLAVRALAQESSEGSAGYGSQSADPPSVA